MIAAPRPVVRLARIVLLLVLASATWGATRALAQEVAPTDDYVSNTKRLFLHARLSGSRFDIDGGTSDQGGGLGLRVGYGFTRFFLLYVGLEADAMPGEEPLVEEVEDTPAVAYFDVGVQVHLGAGASRTVPYLDAALTGFGVGFSAEDQADDVTLNGGAYTLGGGLKLFFARHLALDLYGGLTVGEFTTAEGGGVTFGVEGQGVRAVRLGVGLSWFPHR